MHGYLIPSGARLKEGVSNFEAPFAIMFLETQFTVVITHCIVTTSMANKSKTLPQ
jgi:hypothetical protein